MVPFGGSPGRSFPLVALPVAFCVAWAFPPQALAQTFPARPVKFTSAYASGTGPDIVARLIADKVGRLWNVPTVVEARPGGNGVIAIDAVKKAVPDGHEVLVAGGGHLAINPVLMRSLPYDTGRDFAPVAVMFRTPFFVAVSATGPYAKVADLIDAARRDPGKVSVGTQYIGSPQHLVGVMIEHMTHTQMVHVPYKENAPLFTTLANGDLTWTLATIGTAGPFLKSGRIKLLATTAGTRLPSHPDLPTLQEAAGLTGLDVSVWTGIVAPSGVPADRVAVLNRDILRAMAEPDFQERMNTFGFVARPNTPEEMAALIRADRKSFGEVITRANIKAE